MHTHRVLSGTSHHNMIGVLSGHETVAVRPGRITSSNIGRDKSFVDDLNREQGIVRMRVAFVPRSTEIQPLFWRFVITTNIILLLFALQLSS